MIQAHTLNGYAKVLLQRNGHTPKLQTCL